METRQEAAPFSGEKGSSCASLYVSRLRTVGCGTSAYGCSLVWKGEPDTAETLPSFLLAGPDSGPAARRWGRISPASSRTRCRWSSSRDSTLEAQSHGRSPAPLADRADKERNHRSVPAGSSRTEQDCCTNDIFLLVLHGLYLSARSVKALPAPAVECQGSSCASLRSLKALPAPVFKELSWLFMDF